MINMISNTSSSGLQIVDKVDLPYVELQPKIEFSSSCGNNNNNDMSTNNKMSSFERMKPFTYYTSGISGVSPITTQQCSNAETVNNSNSSVNNKLTANLNGSSQCVTYEPCSLNSSKQEELTKKIIDNFRNDNGKSAIKSGGGGVADFTSVKNKTSSDTSSSYSNSNSSNSSSRSAKSDRQKSPMCRTEDQENAFRQIKVVHNYSKSNRYEYCNGGDNHVANLYSSNSSNQDDDEDDEDDDDEEELEDEIDYEHHINAKVRTLIAIERQKSKVKQPNIELRHDPKTPMEKVPIVIKVEEEEIKPLPDHHARRPMNAFLIFCKRHRGIVKEKYKNFENRSITKILGEWWASLDQNDKTPYVNLAKQNKDAFFSANPNFKWYKLPAPSLRTLNTRPGNTEKPISIPSDYQYELNDSRLQEPLAYSPRSRYEPKREYFKLADETQMGELNNLMRPLAMPSSSDPLQDALGETSDYFKTVCKRKNNSTVDTQIKVKRLNNDNGFSSSEEDILPKKSSRSCKGKKYQELINSGQITPVTPKKQLPSKACATVNTSEENQQFMEYNYRSKTPPTFNGESPPAKQCTQLKEVKEEYDYSECCGSPVKQRFGYVSFDLDDKIKALPAQCLETYLQRKKNTKRKKKINSKKRNPLPKSPLPAKGIIQSQLQHVKTAQEAREQMVGSQKRKARKESITRRDIHSIQNEVQLILCTGSNESNIVVSGASLSESLPVVNQNSTSDLLILAEVAASHTGIKNLSITSNNDTDMKFSL